MGFKSYILLLSPEYFVSNQFTGQEALQMKLLQNSAVWFIRTEVNLIMFSPQLYYFVLKMIKQQANVIRIGKRISKKP